MRFHSKSDVLSNALSRPLAFTSTLQFCTVVYCFLWTGGGEEEPADTTHGVEPPAGVQ